MGALLPKCPAFAILLTAGVIGLAGPAGQSRADSLSPEAIVSGGSGAALHLAAEERTALLRAANAALERSPDPLPVVHVEGTLPTLPAYKRANRAKKDWSAIAVLAGAYAMNREPRHLDGYARYLAAWLAVYRVSGNPIDETALGDVLLAYRSAGAALPPELAKRMRQFACDLADRYTQPPPANTKTSTNNWQSHRVKLAVMGAHLCGRPDLIGKAEGAFAAQIRDNLLPSGESIDFAERDAIHYVLYSIEPLLEAALFAREQGRPLFTTVGPVGQSISRTLEWLAPYARGEKRHEEFVHSRVRFDAERAAAGVAGFSGPFSPKKAQYVFWLAARLDERWAALSIALGSPAITRRAAWLVR